MTLTTIAKDVYQLFSFQDLYIEDLFEEGGTTNEDNENLAIRAWIRPWASKHCSCEKEHYSCSLAIYKSDNPCITS